MKYCIVITLNIMYKTIMNFFESHHWSIKYLGLMLSVITNRRQFNKNVTNLNDTFVFISTLVVLLWSTSFDHVTQNYKYLT